MEEISDITECCICTEIFTDPRMLPCIHTFCLKCLEATRSRSETNPRDIMPCPLCRQQFTIPPDGLPGLRKNYFMERLIEIAKISKPLKTTVLCDVCLINKAEADIEVPDALKYCVDCQENMCEICSVQHKRYKFSRDHQIVPFGCQLKDELVKVSMATYCIQHNKEELKMYCADCKNVICMMCFAESHQLHKCSDVTKVADAFKDEIDIFVAKVVDGFKAGLARKLQVEQEKLKFIEESKIAEAAIKDQANYLKGLIDKHENLLLDELVQINARRMREGNDENKEIERYLTKVISFKSYCCEIKAKGTPADICISVHDLHTRADELYEATVTQFKEDSSAVHVSFKTSAVGDTRKVKNIVGSLEGQHNSLEMLKTKKEQPVFAEFIAGFRHLTNVQAVTKLDNKIYCLMKKIISIFESVIKIRIYDDQKPFQLFNNIEISEISCVQHVVSCERSRCLYISDSNTRCIWKLTVDDCLVTQFLPILGRSYFTLSLSKDGKLLLLRDDEGVGQLEIYGSDATVIQSISLTCDIACPIHVIQESNGLFIIIHKSENSFSGTWVISELSSEGQILRQFQSRESPQELWNPYHMSLDSESNRLFVIFQRNDSAFTVAIFDISSLDWRQSILRTKERLLPLFYDERMKQLVVGKSLKFEVYRIQNDDFAQPHSDVHPV